ncbi:hypothetical protein HMPREF9065_01358 [Aggregatibacter sp. oral taxon 458 str. W10330]|nr:hypothetical protein HMPREF9065_01358 [Aggregatibacter sp. oral taxon 458 str. W10330]
MAVIWLSLRCVLFNKCGEISIANGHKNIGKQKAAIAHVKGLNPDGKF